MADRSLSTIAADGIRRPDSYGDIRLRDTAARCELRLTEPSLLTQLTEHFTHIMMISTRASRGKDPF